MIDDDPTDAEYQVLINAEGQYAVWPTSSPVPAGWADEGTRGPRRHCLAHIERVWTDMRPPHLRRFVAHALAR